MRTRKKRTLWAIGVLASPLILIALLFLSLYLPPVQRWAIKKACAYASEQTGWDVSIEQIRLKFPIDLDLQGVQATNPDTLFNVEHVFVDLNFNHFYSLRLGVDALDIEQGIVDTQDLITTLRIKGSLENFHLNADDISLRNHLLNLTAASLSGADVDIQMQDTTVVDTSESEPAVWRLLLGDIRITDSHIAFHMPGDTLSVQAGIDSLVVTNGDIDLANDTYQLQRAVFKADSVLYDRNYEPQTKGFDYNHLALHSVALEVADLAYVAPQLSLTINQAVATDKSGLQLVSMNSHLSVNNTHLSMPDLQMATTHSTLDGNIQMDFDALDPLQGGDIQLDFNASIGKGDVAILSPQYAEYLPNDYPIVVAATAQGNIDTLHVDRARLMLEPMIDAQATGTLTQLLNSEQMDADVNLDVRTYDLSTVHRLAGLGNTLHLPQMHITGTGSMHGNQYATDLLIQQGRGTAKLKGNYNTASEVYQAKADIRNLQLHNFLPKDSLYALTATLSAEGKGTDLLARSTRLTAKADITHLQYGKHNIDSTLITAKLRDGQGVVDFSTDNDLLTAQACIEAQIDKSISLANFSLDVNRIDLHALGLVDKTFVAGMLMHVDGSSNLSDTHQASGSIQAMEFILEDTIVHPMDLKFAALLSPDSLYAMAEAGDLELELQSSECLDSLRNKTAMLTEEIKRQFTEHQLDQSLLKQLLPHVNLHLISGNSNPVCNMLATVLGYTYHHLQADIDCNPTDGLNSEGCVYGFNTGAIQLDTIRYTMYQDTTGVVNMKAHVENGPQNKQVVFRTDMAANLTSSGADASLTFYDAHGAKGMDIGLVFNVEHEGMRLHLYPLNPIIAYRGFTLNKDNYIYLRNDRHLEANVDLLADDGTGFKLYTTPNEEALQDITLSVHDFNLGELTNVLPYMPDVRGILAGDFHLVQDEQSMSVSVDAQVADLIYEGAEMGTVGLNAMYLPNSDGTHYVDGIVSHNGNDVIMLAGTYDPQGEGSIDADATLQRVPLSLANGFIPNQMAALAGYGIGELHVNGPVSAPIVNGDLCTDSMYLSSDMYSLNLRFPNDTLHINNSRINLNRIEAYSSGKRPIVLDGTIDCQNLSDIGMNLTLNASNFELINAAKTRKAVAYGKVYVDLGATLRGTLNNMLLRGSLSILGNTDVTYVLTDSPLTVEDQLADLVTFVDFSDTTRVAPQEAASPQHIDMQMNINIEQATQVHCLLSEDGTNYVDLEGGGDLLMTYTTQNGLKLYGKYTVLSGTMNYSLMVMSLKDCSITNGSYVEFTGDMMNPRLSLSASERVKTTVYENSVPRSVSFDVGMAVSQTLENMGLEFTLEAPEDLTISNQLASMSTEERGKVAVTMLATGMYLTDDGTTSGFSGTNALNSFLQTQISAISNKALGSIDLNFGVDNTNTASGATQTDYNFSFAKRFWGNRISLIIGGKVSSGSEAQNTGQSIIDNVSLEYRLDKSATRYVRLYYDRNTESLMEGEITEMGAGIVFRKKSTRLGELFIFRNKKK